MGLEVLCRSSLQKFIKKNVDIFCKINLTAGQYAIRVYNDHLVRSWTRLIMMAPLVLEFSFTDQKTTSREFLILHK